MANGTTDPMVNADPYEVGRSDERRLERGAVVDDLRREANAKSPIVRDLLRELAGRYERGEHRQNAATVPLGPLVPREKYVRLVAVLRAAREPGADAAGLIDDELARIEGGA